MQMLNLNDPNCCCLSLGAAPSFALDDAVSSPMNVVERWATALLANLIPKP